MGRVGDGVPERGNGQGSRRMLELGERYFGKRGAKESIYKGIAMGSAVEKESWGVTAEWLSSSPHQC